VLGAVARYAAREYLSAFRDELAEFAAVLVVYIVDLIGAVVAYPFFLASAFLLDHFIPPDKTLVYRMIPGQARNDGYEIRCGGD
jgi:hypothetical protein